MGISVELSDAVSKELGEAKADQSRLQKDINDGLEELAKTDKDAKALLDSGQKIRIVCFSEKEAQDAGLKPGSVLGGQAETKGDFDDKGLPKKAGTALIAIDCDQLHARGWWKKGDMGTLFDVLVHELLHATNKTHTHDKDGVEVYDAWVKNFVEAMKKKQEKDGKKTDSGGGSSKGEDKDKKKKAPSKPKNRKRKRPKRSSGRRRPPAQRS